MYWQYAIIGDTRYPQWSPEHWSLKESRGSCVSGQGGKWKLAALLVQSGRWYLPWVKGTIGGKAGKGRTWSTLPLVQFTPSFGIDRQPANGVTWKHGHRKRKCTLLNGHYPSAGPCMERVSGDPVGQVAQVNLEPMHQCKGWWWTNQPSLLQTCR